MSRFGDVELPAGWRIQTWRHPEVGSFVLCIHPTIATHPRIGRIREMVTTADGVLFDVRMGERRNLHGMPANMWRELDCRVVAPPSGPTGAPDLSGWVPPWRDGPAEPEPGELALDRARKLASRAAGMFEGSPNPTDHHSRIATACAAAAQAWVAVSREERERAQGGGVS